MQNIQTRDLFDLQNTIAQPLLEECEYPWLALPQISDFIKKTGKQLDKAVFEERAENIWIAKSAQVAGSAAISAPCIICENAEVRHCAFIRGSVIIGEGAVVGNSTELKNCILFNLAQVPHYNYVGDSILGYKAHLGASALTSNVKGTQTNISIKTDTKTIETGLKKVGAMLGDNTEIGCAAVLNPGTIVGKNTQIYPLCSVRGVISENSIYKSENNIVLKK